MLSDIMLKFLYYGIISFGLKYIISFSNIYIPPRNNFKAIFDCDFIFILRNKKAKILIHCKGFAE